MSEKEYYYPTEDPHAKPESEGGRSATSCSARVWHCVGHNPTRWSLIQQTEDDTIGRIDAHATRRKDGSWHYRTTTPDQVGVEPSLDEAIKASNAILQNAQSDATR